MIRPHRALAALLLLPAFAMAEAPPVAPGAPYAGAREALLAAGWTPVSDADADRCAPADSRCAGRPEMVACAGTGTGPCLFAWRRGATAIEVITAGPEAMVTGWRLRR